MSLFPQYFAILKNVAHATFLSIAKHFRFRFDSGYFFNVLHFSSVAFLATNKVLSTVFLVKLMYALEFRSARGCWHCCTFNNLQWGKYQSKEIYSKIDAYAYLLLYILITNTKKYMLKYMLKNKHRASIIWMKKNSTCSVDSQTFSIGPTKLSWENWYFIGLYVIKENG